MKFFMNRILSSLAIFLGLLASISASAGEIPLPEHPRPDFERPAWQNLNGTWQFTFNETLGRSAVSAKGAADFDREISVPFGWGSALSGVPDEGDAGWYARDIVIPKEWEGKRIFLVVGASDWETHAWLNGRDLGVHQGGYTPFEFELTDALIGSEVSQHLLLRADDTPDSQHLAGKQGYGNVRGIWQTVYLEARPDNYIKSVHFTPDIDRSCVHVEVSLDSSASKRDAVRLHFPGGEVPDSIFKLRNESAYAWDVPIPDQHLWTLDDPYLYEVEVALEPRDGERDVVSTYFGQRSVGVTTLPGTDYSYVALNGKPIYLQLTLDQSYNPEGFYTFPSDQFARNEILIAKRLGLNGIRVHIKVEVPRKLYWADRLGLLVMADTPNWWDEPKDEGKTDWERAMRGMIERDYNHPSVFSWVNFNETWGLFTPWEGEHREYKKDTQEWVRDMYYLAKSLDPSRLVEDMSPCNYDHVESDLNTWHAYLPGHGWEKHLDDVCANTYQGSSWNYTEGNTQNGAPMLNSECGNVWGYDGSTGDVDITWDYHLMMNAFRAHPKCAGWLYTEHHDVINEWNGYVRYDRSEKVFGLEDFVPGMTIADFHSAYYVSPRCDLLQEAGAGSAVQLPLFLSVMTDNDPGGMSLELSLAGWDDTGLAVPETRLCNASLGFVAYENRLLEPVSFTLPSRDGLYVVRILLKGGNGRVLHRNFTLFRVKGATPSHESIVSFSPDSYSSAEWSLKKWHAMDGKKVDGAGDGYFEYTVDIPSEASVSTDALLVFEASAKQLFGKDASDLSAVGGDFMRGEGTLDPCRLPNSYAQTDGTKFPSMVRVIVNGEVCGTAFLEDDPADHRGALSWYSQGKTKHLDEAGSYGYRVEVPVPARLLQAGGKAFIRLEVPQGTGGGLAVYGADSGRFPMDPTLILR